MTKLKFIISISLLAVLVLVGTGCKEEEQPVDLNKNLSGAVIQDVLRKTANDLGWTGYKVDGREGWYTLQMKSGLVIREGLYIIKTSYLPMIIEGSTKENFIKKGQFPPHDLRILKDIVKARTEFKKGKLKSHHVNEARKNASILINDLIEYNQRRELVNDKKKSQ